jgi:clan AA aspartic protease (TIGR02281 family)
MRSLRITVSVILSAIELASVMIAPALAADPFGDWLTGDNTGKVRVVNCGGALCGKFVWLQYPIDPQTNQPKTDKNNVEISARGRPLLGVSILLSMNPSDTADKWVGQVYNAEDGNTYLGSFTMKGANTAQLKACGMGGLFCKAQTWTRTAAAPNEIPSVSKGVPPKPGVPLKKAGGTFVVPVQINGAITLNFTIDSGADDVSVPADVFSTLARTGTIRNSDIIGEQTYVLADGSKTQSVTFTIRSLKVGDRVVENVRGSVAPQQGSLLLGQSFLERFKSWSVDNTKHVLVLEP